MAWSTVVQLYTGQNKTEWQSLYLYAELHYFNSDTEHNIKLNGNQHREFSFDTEQD